MPGEWLCSEKTEWVMLVQGAAKLLFEHDADASTMRTGDYVIIPAGNRHRVTWTDPNAKTIWLTLHY